MAAITLQADPRWLWMVERYSSDIVRFACEVCSLPDAPPPSIQQQAIMRMIAAPKSRVSVASGHGCFAAGTLVMLSDGRSVPVESVRIGDMLMGSDGESQREVEQLRRGREAMYRFTYMDGTSHVVNESHTLCLVATNSKGLRKSGDKIVVTVRDWLTWGEDKKRCHAIYRSAVKEYARKDLRLPIPAYVFGAWLGDGHNTGGMFTTADPEILAAFSDYCTSIGHRMVVAAKAGKATTYRISIPLGRDVRKCNIMRNELVGLGVLGNKHIPDNYLYAPLSDRLELLAGLIDTDGSMDAGSGGFDFVSKHELLARQVTQLARSVGCHATVREVTKVCTNNGVRGQYWRVTIGRNCENIPVRVPHKKTPERDRQRKNLHFGIRSCEPIGEGEYFGFTLDGDGTFLGSDFTVLHNTGKTFTLAVVVFWHLTMFPESHTLLTANDIDQLKTTFWKEFGKLLNTVDRGPFGWLASHVEVLADATCRIRGFESTWFVESKTANAKNANKLAGRHGKHFMILADEAASIPDSVMSTLNGALTEKWNRFILTSQFVRTNGFFARTQGELSTDQGGTWTALQLSSADSPWVNDENFKELWDSYDDDERAVRLLGQSPQNASGLMMGQKDALSMYRRGRIIKDNESFGYLLLNDVGSGEGERDKSSAVVARVTGWGARGENARRVEVFRVPIFTNEIRSNVLSGHLMDIGADFQNVTYVTDAGGLGVNVCQDLEDAGRIVVRVLWGKPCFSKENVDRYLNLRAQAMHHAALAAKQGRLSILTDDYRRQMLAQSSRIPKKFGNKGRMQVPEKHGKEWEGMPSPDLWDAVCFAFLEGLQYIPVTMAKGEPGSEGGVVSAVERMRARRSAMKQELDQV